MDEKIHNALKKVAKDMSDLELNHQQDMKKLRNDIDNLLQVTGQIKTKEGVI